MDRKQQIITALQGWIAQRPGLEFGNYGNVSNYRNYNGSVSNNSTSTSRAPSTKRRR